MSKLQHQHRTAEGDSARARAVRVVSEHETEPFPALAARGAKDGLWELAVEEDAFRVSPRWCALVGLAEEDLEGSSSEWWSRIDPEDVERVRSELTQALESESRLFESEHRMRLPNGGRVWVFARGLVAGSRDDGDLRVAGSLTDITLQKQAEERLRHDASHDHLTGLPNRATLMEHLRRLVTRARRSRRTFRFAVLFLDFDRFKRVNDSLGHLAGDQLLVAIGHRLRECVRPGDTVARLGGDEFAIVLENLGELGEATRVAERVHQALREPFLLQGIEVFITTSIGIAIGSRSYESPEDLLHDADIAMYRAKALGKGRHAVYDAQMSASAAEQLQLEADLRRGVERDEFRLLYQPIVTLRERRVCGLEAFTRWKHPTRGLLTPSVFLNAAEETGLIVELGFWGVREACLQMQRFELDESSDLTVHVNLSDKQLFHPELTDRIEALLVETRLSPPRLVLDVRESVVMQKADAAVATLAQLKSLGLRIHLDDFGTGYSSLGYLHRFEIDTLKIDRSFVRHLRAGGDNWIAVRTIVGLAQSLGMDVIAEGVETEEQLDELLELGCAFGQGSLFSPPLSPDEVQDLFV